MDIAKRFAVGLVGDSRNTHRHARLIYTLQNVLFRNSGLSVDFQRRRHPVRIGVYLSYFNCLPYYCNAHRQEVGFSGQSAEQRIVEYIARKSFHKFLTL